MYTAPQKKEVVRWKKDNGDKTLGLEYHLDQKSIVFDVGGYEGQWASDIFAEYLCTVHIFEPVSEFATNIKKRFRRNSNIIVHPFGLSNKTSTADIAILKDSSSVFRQSDNKEAIRLKNIMEVISEQKITGIDLIKINVEGGEYDLLELLIENGFHKKIKDIQVQFHDIATNSEQRMQNIRKELEKTHHLTYCYNFVWENWRLNESNKTAEDKKVTHS